MADLHEELSETHIVGENCIMTTVRAETCPALAQRHIAHVGVGDTAVPLRVVRTHLSGAYLHGSLDGEGQVLLDGRWRRHLPGMMSLAPAHVLHAFHAIPQTRWRYCWVRYTPASPRSATGIMAPMLAAFDSTPLAHAILGLAREMDGAGSAGGATLWIDLIEHYVSRFADPLLREERLRAVWNRVQSDLGHDWSLAELAGIANASPEHLRRLCQQRLGRSPMQQLTYLRMQHAAHLLARGEGKIEDIARRVGYQNPFAFSNTFKRMTGFRPSRFQVQKRAR